MLNLDGEEPSFIDNTALDSLQSLCDRANLIEEDEVTNILNVLSIMLQKAILFSQKGGNWFDSPKLINFVQILSKLSQRKDQKNEVFYEFCNKNNHMIEFVVSLLDYNNLVVVNALNSDEPTDKESSFTEIQCRSLEIIG